MNGAAGETQLLAEFSTVDQMLAALETLRRNGYRDIETFSPFDLPEVDSRLGASRSRLPWVALAGGALGLAFGYAVQWYTNVRAYPINVGGRPVHAIPAFLIVAFELMILGAAVATFIGFLVWLRFPRLWAREDEVEGFERASIDRFWIGMANFDSPERRTSAAALLDASGALRTIDMDAP